MARMSALLGLQEIELFKGLDRLRLREIAAQCRWIRLRRNQYVVRRGATDQQVYFVIAGLVRIAAPAGRGRRIIFRDVGAGGLFGEQAALDARPHFADAQALRESLLASMRPEIFQAMLASDALVRERLLHRLTDSVRELADRLLELGAQPVQRRILIELLRFARAAAAGSGTVRIDPAPTHSDIASRVGTSREQVTRALSRLARQGLLGREGRALVLRDVAGLEQLKAESLL
jgi:CRP-like cAMP-binding protein